jgi:ABC-2 type transport system ATP-binding protein
MMSDAVAALEMRGVSKSYGEIQAVRKLDLTLRRGEVYGFLGLNGAGKTTTIRMALGLVRPDSGEVRAFGKPLREAGIAALARTGALVETAASYPNLTVRENLELRRAYLGADHASVESAMGRLGIEGAAGRKAGKLSLGNRQRLAIALALVGNPECLILDEPANGLDPAGIVEVRRLLAELAHEGGAAILVSSHLLAEVERFADRVGIIHKGELIEELTQAELEGRLSGAIELETRDAARAEAALRSAFAGASIERTGPILLVRGAPSPDAIAEAVVRAGVGLVSLGRAEGDLEGFFLKATGGRS